MPYTDRQLRLFSQIAYTDLDQELKTKQLDEKKDAIPLRELLEGDTKTLKKLKALGITDDELDNWKLAATHDQNAENGFYACVIQTSDEPLEAAVAFRGSEKMEHLDSALNDWVNADLGLLNSTLTTQQAEARKFLSERKDLLSQYSSLEMTGHSLGGNLAEYATIVSEDYGLDGNISRCVSLDGPGFSDEFIATHRSQIEHMRGKMTHYSWSLVGTLLNRLPGQEDKFLKVSNDANKLDEDEYNDFSRHDTKFLEVDSNGSFCVGEQDTLSKCTSWLSKQIDDLPRPAGDALVCSAAIFLLSYAWVKDRMFDDDGNLTPIGVATIVAVVSTLPAVAAIAFSAVVVIAAVAVTAFVVGLAKEVLFKVVDVICDFVGAACNWVAEKVSELRDAIISKIDAVKKWAKENFDKGYKYATSHPQIRVDPDKLTSYATRLRSVNSRIAALDRRLDGLYWKVGLLGLWDLMQADILTGYSFRLRKCVSYLVETASDFTSVELNLLKKL